MLSQSDDGKYEMFHIGNIRPKKRYFFMFQIEMVVNPFHTKIQFKKKLFWMNRKITREMAGNSLEATKCQMLVQLKNDAGKRLCINVDVAATFSIVYMLSSVFLSGKKGIKIKGMTFRIHGTFAQCGFHTILGR